MDGRSSFDESFTPAIIAAGKRARQETLAAGVPVFYRDSASGMEIMERPDGHRFEIQYLAGVANDPNYRIIRELGKSAA